ncbi:MAG: N-succinylarginine dihydrolase [Hyphomonas sp.]|uniref:N-succinylarginine dihydrolase n=1 Tax=Hyphomonas sp. TaxID=87 RepID=UPI001796E192|nr:N-succinylarginine dihydrolase [Hyphomonas sp.]MBU3920597.1 N-succinylarginine dihydrolase [Alphaproteobacteria bacterium]MBA3067206.1 N-succinylarginine dihydrolase [Hyphomonas sp.]MBU4061184.1 N-succinylarginine dihydrolase [Alphaproteobacteria bacterium]MBU4165096.1 N-succinylarginine dihydrolase [Alphaproteobacteria bacterium]MBU4568868.1 N-succinylarginine dihydrolase [Alphaproteobacteria bacterium]
MNPAFEVNFDGLIGPSHNYGGLSDGNLASARNAGDVSNPREAAVQGLEKMRTLVRAGLVQGVLPPLARPNFDLLAAAGFLGADAQIIEAAARTAPRLLKAAYSASSMWTANAATVSPSADTSDGRLHLTAANLSTMLHRSIEHPDTTATLISIFAGEDHFAVHGALPAHGDFADEGAANHVRLCNEQGAPGVELFVYGRDDGESTAGFPARQTRLASESVARSHELDLVRVVFARQARRAIEAGAFHNDVVCVGALDTLFFHEFAFEDTAGTLDALRRSAQGLFDLKPVMVPDAEVPLADAISSYLFNSQLLQLPGEDRLVLFAPGETQDTASTRAYCERLVTRNGPIGRVEYVDVRQSMRNGGGPACLRLRVVMTEDQLASCHSGVLLDEERIDELQACVRATYRDRLSPADLADPAFADECRIAREALLGILELDALT